MTMQVQCPHVGMSAYLDRDGTILCEFCGTRLQAKDVIVIDGIIRNVAVPAQAFKAETHARDERKLKRQKRVRRIVAKMRGQRTKLEP